MSNGITSPAGATLGSCIRLYDKTDGSAIVQQVWSNGDGTFGLLPVVGSGDTWTGDFLTADQAIAVRDVGKVRATYRASINGLTPSSSGGFALSDIFTISPSSSNNKITRLNRCGISITGGAGQYVDVLLNRRSARDSSGTAGTVPTAVPMDPNDAASGAILATYSGSPSSSAGLGALVGQISAFRLFSPSSSAAAQTYPYEFEFFPEGKRPTLRASTDVFSMGLAPDGARPFKVDLWAEWTEAAA